MIDQAIEVLKTPEKLQIFVITLGIFGLSPYGIFLLRYIFAAISGKPRPRLLYPTASGSGSPKAPAADFSQIPQGDAAAMSDLRVEILRLRVANARLEDEVKATYDYIKGLEERIAFYEASPQASAPPESLEVRSLRILGLALDQVHTPDDIKRVYRQLVKRHHPDVGGDAMRLQEVQEAYEILRKYYSF